MILKPGDRIVARGLPVNRGSKANRLPPSIALVARVEPGRLVIRLRVGGMGKARFSKLPRECEPEHAVRMASAREVQTGVIFGVLVAA